MATISNTPRPGYVWDATDNVWYPIGVGGHSHSEIAKTIADAKGDLIVGTAADTVDRLAVGNNGETLVADSAATTGLRYQATPAASNPVINSGFEIWQRGTSDFTPINASFTYTADQWSCFRSAGSSGALFKYVSSTTLAGIPNAGRMQRTSGNTSTNTLYLLHNLESKDSTKYQSKTVTLSFYARAGANFSATSNYLSFFMYSGTGTDLGGFSSGWTGAAAIIDTTNVVLTTGWVRYTATGTVSSTANQIGMVFLYAGVGTAGAADYFDITGVQIDVGSVALPYRRNSETIQGELAACQRYYVRLGGAHLYEGIGNGAFESSTVGVVLFPCPVTLRIAATSVEFSSIYAWDYGAARTITNVAINNSGKNMVNLLLTLTGGTQYRPLRVEVNNSLSGYIAVSAEL